ncbi:outer membrane beta-barrel protein [Flavobacterium sp.]|uniref:outer membrane beta-barrel protein n=1 Tax=Flavobacterium sp. TaxID=239 RepID=UPI003265DA72
MKKIVLSAVAILAFGFANAQDSTGGKGFANGDVFISGSVGFSSIKEGDVKTSGFVVAPKVGFFVTDNIVLGGAIGFQGTTVDDGIGEDVKTNTISAGLFGRYYATPSSDFSVFGELGVNYLSSKEDDGVTEDKLNGFNIVLAPGVSYFISDHFALEAAIGVLSYETEKPDVDGAESRNTFNLGLGLDDITLGLVYKF